MSTSYTRTSHSYTTKSASTWRILTLVCSCLSLATAGATYAFGSFAEDLRSRFNFNDKDINIVSGLGNAALYTSYLLLGPMYDHCGVRVTMATATIAMTLGFLLIYLADVNVLPVQLQSVGPIALYYVLACTGACASYAAGFSINLVNYPPRYSGLLVGGVGVFYGLSATLFGQVKAMAYPTDTAGFLLFVVLVVAVVNTVATFGMARVGVAEEGKVEDEGPVRIVSEARTDADDENGKKDGKKEQDEDDDDNGAARKVDGEGMKEHQILHTDGADGAHGNVDDGMVMAVGSSSPPVSTTGKLPTVNDFAKEGMTPAQILKSLTFWLFTMAFIWQQGLTYYSNVGTIVKTVAGVNASATEVAVKSGLQVTILSVSNCISRLAFGAGSDILVTRFRIDRTIILIIGQSICAIPLAIIALSPVITEAHVTAASLSTGIGWGCTSAMFPTVTADLFGLRHYGVASAFVMSAIPVGILISNLIFGSMFDLAVEEGCEGNACFRVPFAIFLGIQFVPILLSLWLYVIRTRERRRVDAGKGDAP